MDQRGGDGRFNGGIEVIATSCGQEFLEFRNVGREDRLCFEQDHPSQEAGGNLEDESAKGETLYDDENTAMEDLAKALQQRDRLQDELRAFQENLDNANMEVNSWRDKLTTAAVELRNHREGLDTAFIELNNCQDLRESARRGLEDVDRKTVELNHDRTRSDRDRCRRATEYRMTVEGELNENLGKLGQLAKHTAQATHALSCGVPDRECIEAKYLQEVLEMIENSEGEALEGGRQASRWRSPWWKDNLGRAWAEV